MQVKDKQFLTNIFKRISASVTKVNEMIVAHQQNRNSVNDVLTTAALEQLAMQQEILIVLATMVFDPGTDAAALPELPTKMIGFK